MSAAVRCKVSCTRTSVVHVNGTPPDSTEPVDETLAAMLLEEVSHDSDLELESELRDARDARLCWHLYWAEQLSFQQISVVACMTIAVS